MITLLSKRFLPVSLFLAILPLNPALAAPSVGTGAAPGLVYGQYSLTPPTLTSGQTAPLAVDAQDRLVIAPLSLISVGPIQTTPATGVGSDTAFPSSVSAVGTTLGTAPAGSSGVLIHLPPGASVSFYVSASVAANSTAAALVSETRSNSSADELEVNVALNGQTLWITNYTSGTATTYTSGNPVFRFM